jgi:protein-arginine kinase
MSKVFETLSGDLAGELFEHTKMTAEQTKQLVDDHFLFRGKDKMQAASGYHEHWPVGRGIFVSKDKKFLLWINEGDHLRIISMEQGGDVRAVFDRLSRGIAAIEAGLRKITGRQDVFMRDDRLGMITCCPSNLGTAMRGSVHIMVPKLIAKMGLHGIDDICRERNCQARGSTGEHSAVVDRIDISNWRRLGFRECDLVQDMIRTANFLAGLEAELEASEASTSAGKKEIDLDFDLVLDENLAANKWPTEKFAKIKSAERVSLMAQAMSEDLFNKLKDIKSPKVCVGWCY